MNYEELCAELIPLEKALKDSVSTALRLQRAIQKNTETGNLAEMKKALDAMDTISAQLKDTLVEIRGREEAFDTNTYFSNGDFTRQLLESCAEKGIDVKGEKGVYEMFPYKVRVLGDAEHAGEVYINRKKIPSFRPSYVAESIRAGQEKLYKANFKAEGFLAELSEAYDTTCLKAGARIGSNQALTKIYKTMVPMARARKEYDMQAFAFDLARLYEAGPEAWVTKDGRQFLFGTSRDGKTGIRVLSSSGAESYISTLKSLAEGSGD